MTESGLGISMETGTNQLANKEVDKVEDWISRLCYEHGLFCASHPRLVIFFAAIVVIACSAPLFSLPLFGGSSTIEWITLSSSGVSVADSRGKASRLLQGNDSTIPRWFVGDPLLYIQQFILMAHVSPWQPELQRKTVVKQALKPAFQITKFITGFEQQLGSHTVNLKDVCLHVTSGPTITQRSGVRLEDQKYLPSKECLLLSPANLWDRSMTRFEQDSSILDSLYQERNQPSFNIALKEFIFGLPLKQTGIYPNKHVLGSHHVIQYAVTLVLSSHDSRYIDELSKELRNQFPLGFSSEKDDSFTPESEKHNVVHIYYKGERRFVELAPLCVTYFIVFLYLAFSVAKIEMVKSKWGLAFSAVITVVASLVMAAGVCSFFGLVSTLDSSEIFPYLVIVIGVENILVITKSVVSTPVDLEVKKRVAQGLSKEGWYIFKNLFTEMIILLSGYCTFIPAVQEFCLFAIVGLSTDLFLQMVFFVTVLSIDIRRMELADLQKQMLQVRQGVSPLSGRPASTPPSPVPSPPQSPGPVQFSGLMPPLPQASLITPCSSLRQCPVIPKKLPKRLNIAYFWARTRMVQKACMICFVLYFVYVLSNPLLESLDTSQDQAETGSRETSLFSREEHNDTAKSTETLQGGAKASLSGPHENPAFSSAARGVRGVPRREFSLKPPPVELWRGLYKQHWPQLLNYYNVSLLGRYVTVLPPVHLGVHIDTELSIPDLSKGSNEDLSNSQGFPSQDGTEPLVSGQETGSVDEDTADPEYYLNAFYCVVLGVVIMIVLFFVCKFLNDLQVNPRSGLCRRRRGYPCRDLVESLPVSLKGHRQNVEHMKVTMSSIISVCLGGQICVWDIATGESLRAINRSSSSRPDASRDRKPRWRKPKHKCSFDGDSGYTGNEKQLSPRPQSDSDSMLLQHLILEEHGIPVNSDAVIPPKPESKQRDNIDDANGDSILSASLESREGLELCGYDFTRCAGEMSLVSRPSRVSSRGSFTSSWSSVGGEDVGWSSSSEASDDELKNGDNINCHRNSAPVVWCVDCRHDIFVAGCGDGTVEIWSLISGSPLYLSRDNHVGITNVHFLSKSNQIVVARLDGMIEFLSLASPCSSGLTGLSVPVEGISPVKRFSPRTARKTSVQSSDVPDATVNTVVSPTGSYACAFPETSPCTMVHRLRAHHQPISVLGVMEGRIITGSHDRTLKVFRTDEFVCVYTLHGHADGITALTVDETNNRQVVSGAANGGVRVWDVISGECLQHLRGHVKAVSGVTCTAVHLISISLESMLCIWDRSRGECLHRLKGFPDLCSNVAMLSQTMFITGGQGRLSVWDVLTGRRVRTVLLGNDDTAVFVRHVHVCENAAVVCDYGKELKVVSFPADMDKAK